MPEGQQPKAKRSYTRPIVHKTAGQRQAAELLARVIKRAQDGE